MWHVIQVLTGKEEEIKTVIKGRLSQERYRECFYIKRERIWRREGMCLLHEETMFPGYLFIDTEEPGEVYRELKSFPQFTKLLRAEEETFLVVSEEEREFLENLIDGDKEKVVRLSEVEVDGEKGILSAKGALRHYIGDVRKKKIRLRYVMIEKELFGKEREILIGIRLKGETLEKAGEGKRG